MATGWFLVPYIHDVDNPMGPLRYCAMDDYTAQIREDGGNWSEAECLGDHAVVKVSAFTATLTTLASVPGFVQVPLGILDTPLGELTPQQRTAIKNKVEALGYSAAEIKDKLGSNWANVTLRKVFRFVLTRRLKPRWDSGSGQIVLDGPEQVCKTIEMLDSEV